jgi:BirA family biotin operon repressor/biotin-[acetyl-CoA-carboxylase] ligase
VYPDACRPKLVDRLVGNADRYGIMNAAVSPRHGGSPHLGPKPPTQVATMTSPPQIPCNADPLDPGVLRAAGFAVVVHLPEIRSTMDEARRLAASRHVSLPAVVVADRQTAGRGRRGAGWWQAAGSLAASLVLDGIAPARGGPPPSWSLACGIALAETLAFLEPATAPRVKWPNDVTTHGRKIAGILVETTSEGRVIFGIGVNTVGHAFDAPPELRPRLATIPDLVGRALPRDRILAELLPRLVGLVSEITGDPAVLPRRYRSLCELDGQPVTLHLGGELHHGICAGIDVDGGLLIDTAFGRRRFVSGSLTSPEDVWSGPEKGSRPGS